MSVLKVYTCSYPAVLVPGIGNGEENKIHELKTAYEKMAEEICDLKPNTIVFVSPLAPTMSDKFYISSIGQVDFSFKRVGHREIALSCRYDDFFADQLKRSCAGADINSFSLACYDSELDEAVAVPLWYIQRKYKDFNIVRVGLSMLSFKRHEDLGKQIYKIADFVGKRTVVIALGQLANHRIDKEHNKSLPEAARFDAEICRLFKFAELSKLKYLDPKFCLTASATDIRSFIVAAGVLSCCEYSSSSLEYTARFGHGNVFSSFDIVKSQPNVASKTENRRIFEDDRKWAKVKSNFDNNYNKGEKLVDFNKSYVNVEEERRKDQPLNFGEAEKKHEEVNPDAFADMRRENTINQVNDGRDSQEPLDPAFTKESISTDSNINVELRRDFSPVVESLVMSAGGRSDYEKKLFDKKSSIIDDTITETDRDESNKTAEPNSELSNDSEVKNITVTEKSPLQDTKTDNKQKEDIITDGKISVTTENEAETHITVAENKSEVNYPEDLLQNTDKVINDDSNSGANDKNDAYKVAKIESEDKDKGDRVRNRRKVKTVYKLPLKSDPYVELAIFAIRYFVQYGKMAPLPNNVPEKILNRKATCFISVYLHDRLMGCIGTLEPKHENLAEEIIYNAVAACKNDQRFRLKSMTDARQLRATVDILGETEAVYSLGQLDPSQYGIVVYKGDRKALLLPRLAGVNTIEQQLGIAATKAGVDVRKIERVYRFAVERHI